VDRIYSFFSASIHRWAVLVKHVPTALKREIDTRWSAHYASAKALDVGVDGVVDALDELCGSKILILVEILMPF